MRFRVGLAIGFATGYVLGAKAGNERYEQIRSTAQTVARSKAGQELKNVASVAAHKIEEAAGDLVKGATDGFRGSDRPVEGATVVSDRGGNGKV
jgi:hypothetical protein